MSYLKMILIKASVGEDQAIGYESVCLCLKKLSGENEVWIVKGG